MPKPLHIAHGPHGGPNDTMRLSEGAFSDNPRCVIDLREEIAIDDPAEASIVLDKEQARQVFNWLGVWLHAS